MRPTVNQVVSGVKRIIEDVLLPDLASEHSRTSAMELVAALDQVEKRWEKVIPNLMEENDDLIALFSGALPILAELTQSQTTPTLEHLKGDIENQLRKGSASPGRYPVYSALEKENDDLRALLAEAILVLEEMKSSYPSDRPRQLRERIRSHLRKYLDKELEWLTSARAYARP